MDDDLMSQLRQGVKRFVRYTFRPRRAQRNGIDVPSTEALMTDAADTIEGHQRAMMEMKEDAVSIQIAAVRKAVEAATTELTRLRKIEATARQIDDWLRDNPAAEVAWRHATRNRLSVVSATPWVNVETSYAQFMTLLTDLRKALETETDG